MRKLKLIPLTAILLFSFFTTNAQNKKRDKEKENEDKDNPSEYNKQAFEMEKDPALGYVPYQRLLKAINHTAELKAAGRNSRNMPSPNLQSSPLTWIERGPIYDSVGPSNGNTRGGANTLGGHTSGRMRAILLDTLNDPTGNTVFAAGIAGGLWKTTNFLSVINNWTPIDDRFTNLAISCIAQDPTNPLIIYFSTGEPTDNADRVIGAGVWKSTNGGISFNWLPSTANFMRCFKIACDAAGNVYLANRTTTVPVNQQMGLLRSTNGGTTWVDITPNDLDVPNTGTSCTDFEITASGILNAMFGYRGVGNKVQHRYTLTPTSVTPGTWSTSTGFRTSNFAAIRTEMAVLGEILYAITINTAYNTDSCYKSVNGGLTWTKQNTTVLPSGLGNGQGWYSISLAINPLNSTQLISGGLDAYRSVNSGSTWTRFTNWTTPQPYVHADHHYAQYWIVGGVARMILGTDGGIFYSPDNGATFSSKNRNLGIKQFYSAAIHPTAGSAYLLAGAQDNGTHQLKNPGLSYSIEVTGGDGMIVHINQQNPLIQFGSYVYNQYRRSTNGGNTWANLNLSTVDGLFVNPFDYDDGQNILYASNGPLGSMRRLLNANTAAANTNVVVGLGAIGATTSLTSLKVSPYTANTLYFGTNTGKVYRLGNANSVVTATSVANTTDISGASFPTGTIICVNTGTNDNNLVATYSNYGVNNVWVTNNGGTSWSAVDGNLPDMPVRWAMFEPGDNRKLFLATEAGIYTTTNINGAATQWLPETTFPTVSTYMLKMRASDSTIVAGTHGRGLWTAKIACIAPAINSLANQGICNGFATNAVTFTGSDDPVAVYSWTNSDPGIGLAASGTGNIASFNAVNTGTTPVVATITVTASVGTCQGSTSFTITVNPTPNAVSTPSSQTVCSGVSMTTMVLSGAVSGTTYNWTRDNQVNVTGIPNSGSGNISGTPINNTVVQQTVTFTITPIANGCTGTPITATMIVNKAPVITCPANITVNNTPGLCGATVTYSPATATGAPAPVITYSQASGTFFPVGTTIVTATATNSCSTVSCNFTITVVDNQPPTIVCPANITVNNTPGLCSAVVTFPLPIASDNCPFPGGIPLTITQNSSNTVTAGSVSCNAGGIHTDNSYWRAFDLGPMGLSGPFTINTVRFGVELATGTGGTQPVTVRIHTSAGAFPGGVRTLVASQTFNVPNQTLSLFTANFTTPPTVPANAILVLEIFTPAGAGNSFFIGSNALPETAPSYLSAAACGVPNPVTVASLGFPNMHIVMNASGTVANPSGSMAQIAGLPSGSIFPVGVTTNTFRVTDASGNTATCSFTVTVVDNQAPTVTCPANIVANTNAGVCTATVATPNPTTADNCGVTAVTWVMTGATTGSSPATGINFVGTRPFNLNGTTGQGVTTITYTVKDAAGNTSTCSYTVTVNDIAIPVVGGQPANQTVCVGTNAVFTVTATVPASNPLTYQWQAWNGTAWVNITGATSATLPLNAVTFSMNTNSYRVILTGLCSVVVSGFATLYVNQLPTVSILASGPLALLPAQSVTLTAIVNPAGGTYQWLKNGVAIAGATGASLVGLTVSDIGTYRIRYTDLNGCVSTSADVLLSGQVSDGLFIYPVPNDAHFHVRFYNQANEEVTVRVFDMKGALVYLKKVTTSLPYTDIDVDMRNRINATETYLVEVRGADGRLIGAKKIIVVH